MKKLFSFLLLFVAVSAIAQRPNFGWAKRFDISDSLKFRDKVIGGISEDSTGASNRSDKLITEAASKSYTRRLLTYLIPNKTIRIDSIAPHTYLIAVNEDSLSHGAAAADSAIFKTVHSAMLDYNTLNAAIAAKLSPADTAGKFPRFKPGTNISFAGSYPNQTINAAVPAVDSSIFKTVYSSGVEHNAINAAIAGKLSPGDTAGKFPRFVPGTNTTFTGTYPNITINSTGGGSSVIDSIKIALKVKILDSILHFGSSVTKGEIGPSDPAQKWTQQLSQRLSASEANRGINGATLVTTGIANLSAIPVYNSSLYRYMVLEWGINDIWPNVTDTATFTAAYRRFIDTCLARGWSANKIVLLTPYTTYQQSSLTRIQNFRNAIYGVATSKGTGVIDIQTAFINSGGKTLLLPDELHPIDFGQSIYVDKVGAYLKDSVRDGTQRLAVNGQTEIQHLKLVETDILDNYKGILLGIDSLGNIKRFNKNSFLYNSLFLPSGMIQPGGINVQTVTANVATFGYGVFTNVPPAGLTTAGLFSGYDGNASYLNSYNYGTTTQKPLILNAQGNSGNVIIGNGVTNLPELLYVTGAIRATYGRFSGAPSIGGTGQVLEVGYSGGQGYIVAANRTSGTWMPVNIGFGLSPNVTIGSQTITGTCLLQVNGSAYTAGNLGVRTSAPLAALHIKPNGSDLTPVIIEGLGTYANDAAATTAGLTAGMLYKTSVGVLMVKL